MASRDYTALAHRARALADRFPASREALLFYAGAIALDWPALRDYAIAHGPAPIADAARTFDPHDAERLLDDSSPSAFFARLLVRGLEAPRGAGAPPHRCPNCDRPPQCACLRPEGDGTALTIVCSLCATEWPFPRGRCPACDAIRIAYYEAAEVPHIQVMTCESCRRYIHVISVARDPEAIPEVDELAALPLDVWAREQGYTKLHPNLAGI